MLKIAGKLISEAKPRMVNLRFEAFNAFPHRLGELGQFCKATFSDLTVKMTFLPKRWGKNIISFNFYMKIVIRICVNNYHLNLNAHNFIIIKIYRNYRGQMIYIIFEVHHRSSINIMNNYTYTMKEVKSLPHILSLKRLNLG